MRWAINIKGEPNLVGPNVKQGRAAVAFGSIPELGDWSVDQQQGEVKVVVHRVFKRTGFALAAEKAPFESFEVSPDLDDFDPQGFAFEKGMILFNRVVGHRPETERYAKLLVEDVTEKPPAGIMIIDTRRQ